ncbi:MAG: hypothetical protein C4318_04335 [Acidimicrobiia bacterium]
MAARVERRSVGIMPTRYGFTADWVMRGVNQVSDFLEEIGEILEHEPNFTERDPVYLLDPTGTEFGIEMALSVPQVPRLHQESVFEHSPIKDPVMFLRRLVNRTVSLRVNPLVDQINESIAVSTGALAESLRRIARSHRHLEARVAALARERHSLAGSAGDRITALEQKVRLLELSVVALEDAINELEMKVKTQSSTEERPLS